MGPGKLVRPLEGAITVVNALPPRRTADARTMLDEGRLDYIADLTDQLEALARAADSPRLARLLGEAAMEARSLLEQRSG